MIMATSKTKTQPKLTLAEIRSALDKVEERRALKEISDEERAALEEASVTLRDAERTAIADIENGIVKEFRSDTELVSLQAKRIREMVSRMNKLPKVLGITESVVKDCIKVLKSIAKLTLVMCFVLIMASCATMSKVQTAKLKALLAVSDSIAASPELMFEKLADVRQERGIMYAMSLDGADNHLSELNSLVSAHTSDMKAAAKSNVYVTVLDSYVSALKSLAADSRWSADGTKLRGIGRNVDSLIISYNRLGWSDKIEPGLSKQIGRTSGFISDEICKRIQHRKLRQVLAAGDSIVSVCCDSLVALMQQGEVEELISNEELGLESNYRSYLNAQSRHNYYVPYEMDCRYIDVKNSLADVRGIQKKCISALKAFKKAHHNLLVEMDGNRSLKEFSDELLELADEAAALRKYLKN